MNDFRSWMVNAKGLAPKSARQYELWAPRAALWMVENRQKSFEEATFGDLSEFHESTKPTAPTGRNCRIPLIAFFNYAETRGLAIDNPATKLGKPRVFPGRPKPNPQIGEQLFISPTG